MKYLYKQVIVVRNDLKLSKGKLSVQVAHASVTAFYKTLKVDREKAISWLENSQPKIVVKVKDKNELIDIYQKALDTGLIAALIRDAGLTELPPGTLTCIGIGPDEATKIDKVTGHLPLL